MYTETVRLLVSTPLTCYHDIHTIHMENVIFWVSTQDAGVLNTISLFPYLGVFVGWIKGYKSNSFYVGFDIFPVDFQILFCFLPHELYFIGFPMVCS